MFAQDVLVALYTILITQERPVLAGCFDGLSDLAQVIAIGGGAATVYQHALGLTTALTFLALFVGSVAGAVVGDRISARFLPMKGKP